MSAPLTDTENMTRFWRISIILILVTALTSCGHQQLSTAPADSQQASNDDSNQRLPFSKSNADDKDGSAATSSLVPTSATIPAGTPVLVRLQESLSSATAAPGQQFDAVLDEPLVIDGETVAQRGTHVVGRVVAARHSGGLHNPGYLRLTLSAIELKGKSVPLESSSFALKGGSHRKRNLALIGGGTGAGALIGGLAGGGKGALIGALIGGGAGTGTAYASGKKDVGLSAERRLSFRLLKPVSLNG